MSLSRRLAAVPAAGLLLLAGCSDADPKAAPQPSLPVPSGVTASGTATPGPGASAKPSTGSSSKPSGGTTSGPGSSAAASPGSGASARPSASPSKQLEPVEVRLDADCVAQGGKMTLHAHSQAKRGVAYQAVYNGEKGGGPPPFGHGYGGNDKGFTDSNGNYTSTWTVAINAPLGPARVDVYVGATDGFRQGTAKFRVVSSPYDC